MLSKPDPVTWENMDPDNRYFGQGLTMHDIRARCEHDRKAEWLEILHVQASTGTQEQVREALIGVILYLQERLDQEDPRG